jgi:flagellar P-ring protein precursor FlgI
VRLQLKQADFSTAARIAAVVNRRFPDTPAIARAESAGTVAVKIPPAARSRTVEFLAELENLTVEMDRTSKIVINERTGTIVAGRDVRIAPVSILHGALTVEIRTQFDVSQPAPFGRGETTPIAQPEVAAREEKAKNVTLQDGATVEELAKALLHRGAELRDRGDLAELR